MILRGTNQNKTCVRDMITVRMLLELAEEISPSLVAIFQKSLFQTIGGLSMFQPRKFLSSLKVFSFALLILKIISASLQISKNISQFSLKCIFSFNRIKIRILKNYEAIHGCMTLYSLKILRYTCKDRT